MAKLLYMHRKDDREHDVEFDEFMETVAPEHRLEALHTIYGRLLSMKCQIQHHDPPFAMDQQGQYRIDDLCNTKQIVRDAKYVLKNDEIEELCVGLRHLKTLIDARNSRNNTITAARRNCLKSWRRLSNCRSEDEVCAAVKTMYIETYTKFYDEYDEPAEPHYVLQVSNPRFLKEGQ